jgi:hypothetical protein
MDFGTAYLTERWASRFVAELFNHFTVLFVGYGMNDPVMRYLVDAIGADRHRAGPARRVRVHRAACAGGGGERYWLHMFDALGLATTCDNATRW